MIQKQWILAPRPPAAELRTYEGCSPILARLLYNRGIADPQAAQEFLKSRALSEDPLQLKDMRIAVERIELALAQGQPIAVYGDFDADGVCATALLTQVLIALGGDIQPYIPDREGEGYGLNSPALERLADAGVKLVITVDCGIRSLAEVAVCAQIGMDIIVTDHHSIGPELPPALAVINPQRQDCPGEARLAGVGVAYMLAKALLRHRWRRERARYPLGLRESDLLDLVAIGTVADVMALNVGQNRRLVRHGLATINALRRPGIAALAKVAGLRAGAMKASDIGFGLGPRINAAGRLGSAMTAFHLLTAADIDEAMPYAVELQRLNTQRQRLTRLAEAEISAQLAEDSGQSLIFAASDDILPGIVGLVAGRLCKEHYRPAVVLEYGEELSRASCRSIPEFDITSALDECADMLLRHGGHAMAAGFTVRNSNLDALRQRLQQKAQEQLSSQNLVPKLHLDCELDLPAANELLLQELDLLEPTGNGNPPAAFLGSGLRVLSCRRVGADGAHLKLRLAQNGSAPIDAIGFGLGGWARAMPRRIDAAYQLEMNEWNGRRSLQLQLLDIRPA